MNLLGEPSSRRIMMAGALAVWIFLLGVVVPTDPPDPAPARGVTNAAHALEVARLNRVIDTFRTLSMARWERANRLERRVRHLTKDLKAARAELVESHEEEIGVVVDPPAGARITVSATAYCLTGTMANGEQVYEGAVAANAWPFGTRLYAHELGQTFTVADRIGHGSDVDIAMPGRCDDAIAFGRRTLTVSVVTE